MTDIKNKLTDIFLQSYYIFENKEINFYCTKDQDTSGFILSLFTGVTCYTLSKITGNFSWVDRIWSIIPSIYILHFSIYRNYCENLPYSDRQILMFILSSLWSIRLTYNFYRKGGFNPGEVDYRWQKTKNDINNRFLWELMNIFFISFFENVLLYLLATPASLANKSEINKIDYFLALLYLIFWLIELIADKQQWNFQEKKKLLIKENRDLNRDFKRGFLTNGLFRYSRHPNFFAEISLWWIIYAFSVNASGIYFNFSIIGTIILTLIFQASTNLTEEISSGKYPEYKIYQKFTSKFIPLSSDYNKDKFD